jgi:hypothetical protein
MKMLKMKVDPTMYMKTKSRVTQCLAIEPPFWQKMHKLSLNSGQNQHFLGEKAVFTLFSAERQEFLPLLRPLIPNWQQSPADSGVVDEPGLLARGRV